jgi:type IV pilus modification protein PilV
MFGKGFSLLEVLISLFIISLGLLGIAGLEIIAFRDTQEAYYQSVAIAQLTSMFERFQANLSNNGRTQECHLWSRNGLLLLPNASAECNCAAHLCRVALTWYLHTQHTLTWQADI